MTFQKVNFSLKALRQLLSDWLFLWVISIQNEFLTSSCSNLVFSLRFGPLGPSASLYLITAIISFQGSSFMITFRTDLKKCEWGSSEDIQHYVPKMADGKEKRDTASLHSGLKLGIKVAYLELWLLHWRLKSGTCWCFCIFIDFMLLPLVIFIVSIILNVQFLQRQA